MTTRAEPPTGTVLDTAAATLRFATASAIAVCLALAPAMAATAEVEPVANTGSHSVEAGEDLRSIAREHAVTLEALLNLNGLTWNAAIRPNQIINVPIYDRVPVGPPAATYSVQAGDSLAQIAAEQRVSLDAMLTWNHLGRGSHIRPGDLIEIPAGGANYNILRGPNYTDRVILTYDDCPRSLDEYMQVVTFARENNIGLVIAPTGDCIDYFRAEHGRNLVTIARANGQYVINHSVSHRNLTTLDCAGVAGQLGGSGVAVNFGRPPYGAMDAEVFCGYEQAGMTPWLWDVDTRDWTGKTREQIVAHSVQYAHPGSTVLMHLQWEGFNVTAIDELRSGLAARGLQLCRAYPGTDNVGSIATSPEMLPESLPC